MKGIEIKVRNLPNTSTYTEGNPTIDADKR